VIDRARAAREKVLAGLAKRRGRAHRYTRWRWLIAVAFTSAIAALPAAGILRFDVWSGRHTYLGETASLLEVARRFAFPFLGINLLIIVASRFVGRYLCGFVCPYGAVARLAEWSRIQARRGHRRARALPLAACFVLACVTFGFWLDWRVFVEGSAAWRATATALLIGMVVSFHASATLLGLEFCKSWCPSGAYFALLGPETINAIEFAHPESCTQCKACDAVCPMDLAPRALDAAQSRAGTGLYPDGLSNYALCIRCGDCVAACEATTARFGEPTPLRMGQLADCRAPRSACGTGGCAP
jgi:polyferredoxin